MNRYSYRKFITATYDRDFNKIKDSYVETNPRNLKRIYLGNLELNPTGNIVELSNLTSYGDYNNTCMVHESNYETVKEYLKENHVRFFDVYGGYGYTGIYVNLSDYESDETINEILDALDSYPLFDENHYSELTFNSYLDQWESDAPRDFIYELGREFNLSETIKDQLESRDDLMEFFESLLPSGEWYYDESTGGVYILLSDAAKNCTRSELAKYLYNKEHRASLPVKLAETRARRLQLPLF